MTQKSSRYKLLSNALLDEIEKLDRKGQAAYLFLSPSEDFRGRWDVSSLWPTWFLDWESIVGRYKTITPARLDEFLTYAENGGYQVVFSDSPEDILAGYERLSEPPPFALTSSLDNTVQGMLPWQIQGFNKLVRDESINAGLVIHDTGCGKTAFIAASILWHKEYGHPFDLALVVVKKNNKIDTQQKLLRLGGIESYVVQGTTKQRDAVYEQIVADLEAGKRTVVIANYESFRNDYALFRYIVEDRDCLFFFDEMPTRLSNRTTKLYESVQKTLWKQLRTRKEGLAGCKPRAKWYRSWELSATPIENSPDGLLSCARLMSPPLLGDVTKFHNTYVARKNPVSREPETWKDLDKLEATIEFCTHRVSRKDPEVAKMFPEVMEDPLIIDWDTRDRVVYDSLAKKAAKKAKGEGEEEADNILALIQVMQMLCDAPSMINESAKNRKKWLELIEEDEAWLYSNVVKGSDIAAALAAELGRDLVDDHHTKFDTLHEILTEKHPEDKALIYMTWAGYGYEPVERKLNEWGISYVTYTGTEKERQAAKDAFRQLDGPRVFLSSDKGSDSIDLPEAAVGVNYNLPWTWTRKRQRQGRNNRVDSKLEVNWWYTLIMANSVEERKRDIIATKRSYHEQIFDGAIHDDAVSAKLSREELLWILVGPDG